MQFATKAIHTGHQPDPVTGAIIPPIYMTSTFVQESPGVHLGYDYTRGTNPNFTILEKQLAALEEAKHAVVFSSGLGSMTALASTLSAGDHVFAFDGLYGGTFRLFNQVLNKFRIHFTLLNPHGPHGQKELESLLKKYQPAWLLFETPTNPLMDIFDIEHFVKIAKKHNVKVVVDNTFATPYCQNPLSWEVDLVWHSSTKYLGGHSDVVGGVMMTNCDTLNDQLTFARQAIGVNPSPFDSWLISRGVKTLAVRMEQHIRNARAVVEFLNTHPKVKRVYYPGSPSNSRHEIAKKQMKGFGGMVSAEFNLSPQDTKKLISSFRLFSLAESLGGVESLVCHPATMTHASVPAEERAKTGLSDSLVRFSIGIEDSQDLIDDLSRNLNLFG